MIFIGGVKGETSTAGSGEFFCPQCNKYRDYLHKQVHKKATVFFVPVANLQLLGEYIECQTCKGTFKMEVLDYDPAAEQQAVEALYAVGIKKVMIMMMLADKKIKENEKDLIKKIFKEVSGEELSDEEIEEEITNCKKYPTSMENFLEDSFPYINEQGKQSIVEAAYYISIIDKEYGKEEQDLLKKIAKKLQITSAHLKGIISEINQQGSIQELLQNKRAH